MYVFSGYKELLRKHALRSADSQNLLSKHGRALNPTTTKTLTKALKLWSDRH